MHWLLALSLFLIAVPSHANSDPLSGVAPPGGVGIAGASHGNEFRVGYKYPWRSGRLWLRPHIQLGFRDAKLNNYYYGVRPDEALPQRAAYQAGGGVTPEIGLYAAYNLTERMRIIG